MANQPSAPTAQPPPDVPAMTDVSDTLSQYLRRFSLWCRNGFADKLSASAALRGIPFLGYDAPAGAAPNVYQFEVSNAGVAGLAPVPFHGVPGAFTPIGTVGTKTNDNAAAGSIGEVISSNVPSPGVTLTTSTAANITSISLTAGDWDVSGEIFATIGTGGATAIASAISPTSATLVSPGIGVSRTVTNAAFTAGTTSSQTLRPARVSLAAPATYYLVALVNFPSGVTTAFGNITARRAR